MEKRIQNLVSLNEIIKKTDISPKEFRTWKIYRLLPQHDKKISLGRGKGFKYLYSSYIIEDILRIKNFRKQGLKFSRIKDFIKTYHKTGMSPQEIILREVAKSELPKTKSKDFTTERLLKMWIYKTRNSNVWAKK